MAKYLIALFLVCMAGLSRASTNEVRSAEDRSYAELGPDGSDLIATANYHSRHLIS